MLFAIRESRLCRRDNPTATWPRKPTFNALMMQHGNRRPKDRHE